MAMIKGLFKGICQMSGFFAYKEHEMEIGFPTDVRHVAHIGWDGADAHPPSWMNEFKNARDFSPTSLNIPQSRESSWTSQDFEQLKGLQSPARNAMDSVHCPDIPKVPRKTKRVKNKESSPSSTSSSTTSSRRSSKSTASFAAPLDGGDAITNQIKVS